MKLNCRSTLVLFLVFSASLNLLATAQDQPPGEYQIKAAFLYNFAKFVEWPPTVFAKSDDPLVIGLLGENPFGPDLDQMLAGKTVQDRPVVFRRLSAAAEAKKCQVLFVCASEDALAARILRELEGNPILTVSDMDRFAERGGMIGLVNENRKIRFVVNKTISESSHLKISSELLKLAKAVW